MFNPDWRLIIQLNLQPDAFALIHSLQIFSIWLFTIYNLQILCKAIWRYFGVQECRIKLWTKSVAVHMSGAVLCKKTLVKSVKTLLSNCKYREISENWELTFATISLKERCTDWFTWCNSTVMMTNMKRNNILTTLSFWDYPILNKGGRQKLLSGS